MANILIFNSIVPYPANFNGNSMRVLPLSEELDKYHQCYLAAFGERDEHYSDLEQTNIYHKILLLPPIKKGGSIYRHFFPRSGLLPNISQPRFYKEVLGQLNKFINENQIDLVLAHTLSVAGFAAGLTGIPSIWDEIDSRVLYVSRNFSNPNTPKSLLSSIQHYRSMLHARYQESKLPHQFRFVTTVSPIDRNVLQTLSSKGDEAIIDIPNGVSKEVLIRQYGDEQIPGSIAFWGSLDFPPNESAVRYFYNEVFFPFLRDEPVSWYIIGKGATPEIKAMAEHHENIILAGFVEDLYGLVSRIPVMINPMQTGGGLKNKVLEAFGLKRVVISNSLGIEAIPADPDKHFILANNPAEFAKQTLRYSQPSAKGVQIGQQAREFVIKHYTWEAVGRRFDTLIQQALN